MEDRSKRTETVRPQFGERCKSRSECNSALNVQSDWNDCKLDGETDHEDMGDEATGFGDGSAQVATDVNQANRLPMNTKST